jgi:putative PIN family toxin of toxin-antitoxin system
LNRVVLDTNVVFDLLHFDDGVARPLRQALEAGRLHCVVTDATLEEWRRVLAYPEFALDPPQQAALFDRYQSLSLLVEPIDTGMVLPHKGSPIHCGPEPVWTRVPRCSDPDDQKFLELAAASQAQGLVSKDRALLKLRRRCAPLFRVMTPDEAVRWLAAGDLRRAPAAGT